MGAGPAKIEILKDMIAALSSEPVRRALADWQKDVMQNGPSALKLDDGWEQEMRL